MWKKYVFVLSILLCTAAAVTAQDKEKSIDGEGLVLLKAHDHATGSIVTDSRGQFVFTRYDLKGQPARTLWKMDELEKIWREAGSSTGAESGNLFLVAGKTDPDAVPPGSKVQAVYWEDASGTAWCLADAGATLFTPTLLQAFLSGSAPVMDVNRNSEDKGWFGKFPIRIQYK